MTLTVARRMISAELLKLRKRRSTMLWALFLGAGSMVIYYSYAALDHASDPRHHGPAGGALGFARGLQGLAILPLQCDDQQRTIHFQVGHASLMQLKRSNTFHFTQEHFVHIFYRLAEFMLLLQEKSFCHSDIKPDNAVLLVNADHTTTPVADLSAFQKTHPVQNPEPDDFEPPTPGTGKIVRIDEGGQVQELASGLSLPTAMTFGPDGNLYVSNRGFGNPPGAGQVVKVTVPSRRFPRR